MDSSSSSKNLRSSFAPSAVSEERFHIISRGTTAMTDTSMPRTRGSTLSEPSADFLSNSLRTAEGDYRGREFFTKSRQERVDMGNGTSYSLTKRDKDRDKKYINPRAQSPSDPPDPLQRYRTACWNVFMKFSQTMDDLSMEQCEMGLPFDNLFHAVRNISKNDTEMLQSFDTLVHSFQFKQGHIIPWAEFREFVDQLFLGPGDESIASMNSSVKLGYDLEQDSEVDADAGDFRPSSDIMRKEVASPYSQLMRKNRNASVSGHDNPYMDQSLELSAGSISDRMGTYKLPDNIMAKALTKSVHKYRDAAHLKAGDSILSTFSQLTYNNSKLKKKFVAPHEHDSIVPCQRTVRASCSGGIQQRDFEISYQGPFKVVKEPNKVREIPFESTLRDISPDVVDRLEKDDYVKKYNERGDSRLYRVKYDAEDERKETPISYDEVPGRRKPLDSDAFTVSMAPSMSESVATGAQSERFKNDLDKSKIVEILDPRENYMNKWFAMKEKRDMRRHQEKFRLDQHKITKVVQNTLFMKQKSDLKQMGNLSDEVRRRQIDKQKQLNYTRRQQLDDSIDLVKKNRKIRNKEMKKNIKSSLRFSIESTKQQLENEKLYKRMAKHPPVHNVVPYSSSKVDIPSEYNDAVAKARTEKQFEAAKERRRNFVEKSLDTRIHQFTENKRRNLVKLKSAEGSGSSVISNYPLRGEDLFEDSEIEPSVVLLSPLNSRSAGIGHDDSSRSSRALKRSPVADEDAMLMDYDKYLKSAPQAQLLQMQQQEQGNPFTDSPTSLYSRKSLRSVDLDLASAGDGV